jgi:hypothetical protein
MTVIEEQKIMDVSLDPRWKVGKVKFDGAEHIFITMQHPKHINVTWLIPREQAAMMGKALIDLAK